MIRDSIRDKCRGRWPSILMQLGFPREALTGRNVKCPVCGGTDRFRWTDKNGDGTAYCNQCGGSNGTGGGTGGVKLLMAWKGVSYRGACEMIEEIIGKAALSPVHRERAGEDQARAAMRWMWENAKVLGGYDPPSIYLKSRGIDILPPGTAVRYVESMPDYDAVLKKKTYHPAMIARMVNHERGALHITYLTIDGQKANVSHVKRFFTGARVPVGGAVRLGEAAEFMGVSTGIETCLSASMKHNGMVVWAVLSDVGFLKFDPPPECRHLTIFGDGDELFDGQMASVALAHRLARVQGIRVAWKLPPESFKDWNDVIVAERAAGPKLAGRIERDALVEDDAGEGDRQAIAEHEDGDESPQAFR